MHYYPLFISLSLFTKGHKTTVWNNHVLHVREIMNYIGMIFKISFSKFLQCLTNSVWDISDYIDKLYESNFSQWLMGWKLLPSLLKLLLTTWAVSVCLHFQPSICSVVAFVFCLNISLPFIQLLPVQGTSISYLKTYQDSKLLCLSVTL